MVPNQGTRIPRNKDVVASLSKLAAPISIVVIILLVLTMMFFLWFADLRPATANLELNNQDFEQTASVDKLLEFTDKHLFYATADYDDDGLTDIALASNKDYKIKVQLSSQPELVTLPDNTDFGSLTAGRYLLDKSLLLSVSSDRSKLRIFEYDKEARIFQKCGQTNLIDMEGYEHQTIDLNGDGVDELLWRAKDKRTLVWSTNQSTCDDSVFQQIDLNIDEFTKGGRYLAGGKFNGVDYNLLAYGDGQPSQLITIAKPSGYTGEMARTNYHLLLKLSAFMSVNTYTNGPTNRSLVGDYNGDGKTDLLEYTAFATTKKFNLYQTESENIESEVRKFSTSVVNLPKNGYMLSGKFQNKDKSTLTYIRSRKNNFNQQVQAGTGAQVVTSSRNISSSSTSATLVTPNLYLTQTSSEVGQKYITGDYNGDGTDDIVRYGSGDINDQILLSKATVSQIVPKNTVFRISTGLANQTVFGNLTITEPAGLGFAVIYTCGTPQPVTSNINFKAGDTRAVGVLVKTDSTGNFCLTANQNLHVIFDRVGSTSAFTTSTPTRAYNSLSVSSTTLTAGTEYKVTVPSSAVGNTVFGTITSTKASGRGFATVYPCGSTRPNSSTINFYSNDDIANTFSARVGVNNQICFVVSMATHIIIDIVANTNTVSLLNDSPKRITPQVSIMGAGGVSKLILGASYANQAILGNITATGGAAGGYGYLNVYPCNSTDPQQAKANSTINYPPTLDIANFVLVKADSSGDICVYASTSVGFLFDMYGSSSVINATPPSRLVDTRAQPRTTQQVEYTASNTTIANNDTQAVAGDFNGDGRSEIYWYTPGGPNDAIWAYDVNSAKLVFCSGIPEELSTKAYPMTGDFNGDGVSDIFVYIPESTSSYVLFGSRSWSCGSNFTKASVPGNALIKYRTAVGDFNGDGASDIYWYAPDVATPDYIWAGWKTGSTVVSFVSSQSNIGGSELAISAGDFNGDGIDDVLLHWVYSSGSTQQSALWLGTTTIGFFNKLTITLNPKNTYETYRHTSKQYDTKEAVLEIADDKARKGTNDTLLPIYGPCPYADKGQYRDSNGNCVFPPCPNAAKGEIRDSSGNCYYPPCPSGQTRNSSGDCVAVAPPPSTSPTPITSGVSWNQYPGFVGVNNYFGGTVSGPHSNPSANWYMSYPVITNYLNTLSPRVGIYIDYVTTNEWYNYHGYTGYFDPSARPHRGVVVPINWVMSYLKGDNAFPTKTVQVVMSDYAYRGDECHIYDFVHELAHVEQYINGGYNGSQFNEINADTRAREIIQLWHTSTPNDSCFYYLQTSGSDLHYLDNTITKTDINNSTTGSSTNQFNFSGVWSTASTTGAFKNDEHYSNTANNTYTVTFSGTQISVFGMKYPEYGIAAYSIDGGSEVFVDHYSPSRVFNYLSYTSPVLSNGTHTLKVRVTGSKNSLSSGTYVAADRVVVTKPVITTTPTSIFRQVPLSANSTFGVSSSVSNLPTQVNDSRVKTIRYYVGNSLKRSVSIQPYCLVAASTSTTCAIWKPSQWGLTAGTYTMRIDAVDSNNAVIGSTNLPFTVVN